MFEEHPNCIPPENEEIKIWRFIDFPKFVSMLLNNSLYFSGVNHLEDPFEGKYSEYTIEKTRKDFQKKGFSEEALKRSYSELPELFASLTYVNCWHMCEHEPSSMWKNYTYGNQGIALQSTYKKFKNSLEETSDKINISQIKYIDYKTSEMKSGNMVETIVHKRINYSDERELRGIVIKPPLKSEVDNLESIAKGHHIHVDLDILIESLTLAPSASNWMQDLVKSIMEKFSLTKPINNSKLDELPPNV